MIAWLALCWHGGVASAATVAVLDFDAYGLSFSDALTVTQGVRDAFLEEGALDPLSGSDIGDGVSKGQDDGLRRARELVSEGRRLYTAGDASGALSPLYEAIKLHDGAFSDVGRRPELADATFLLGLCLERTGQAGEARTRFGEAAALVPSYAKERGTRMSSESAALLAEAESAFAKGSRRTRPNDEVGRIGRALDVDYVVTGWVAADGVVSTRMYADGQLVSEARTSLEETPPLPVDGAYNVIARGLAEGGGAAPTSTVAATPDAEVEPDPDADLDLEEEADLEADLESDPGPPPDFDEDDARRPTGARSAGAGSGGTGSDRPSRVTGSSAGSTRVSVAREPRRGSGAPATAGMRYAPRPIVQRWWFWTGAVALAGGGTFGIWYAVSDPPVEYVEEPDGWSITVRMAAAPE